MLFIESWDNCEKFLLLFLFIVLTCDEILVFSGLVFNLVVYFVDKYGIG